MASTYTNNLELEKQGAGDNSGTWGDPVLNQNVIDRIDAAMGDSVSVSLSSSNVTLTQTQWRHAIIVLTGPLSANVSVSFPLSVNSATDAVGGVRVIDNQCTGNFTVTVNTIAVGSTGVIVPQGVKSIVYSNVTNVAFADDRLGTTDIDRIPSVAGSPNGSVTGVAGTAYKPASMVYDRTNKIIYTSTADGTSGWVPQSGYFPFPQGYLTPVSGTAIITSNSSAATAVYYTPYVGNLIPVYDGSWLQPYFFSEMTLTLSASQAANQIYDVFAFLDGSTLRIGTGPAWATPTAGAGARGSGAGTTQISRINGLWTNAVSMTARNGGSSYAVSANQGTYLGSLFMDGTNGQVSCLMSYGQSRKWGVWNAYNRANIRMIAGDSTASWTYFTASYRASNNNSANSISIFSGLAEEVCDCTFTQHYYGNGGIQLAIAIGVNSTSSASGTRALLVSPGTSTEVTFTASTTVTPSLGVNTITSLEYGGGTATTFFGTQTDMLLKVGYRG